MDHLPVIFNPGITGILAVHRQAARCLHLLPAYNKPTLTRIDSPAVKSGSYTNRNSFPEPKAIERFIGSAIEGDAFANK